MSYHVFGWLGIEHRGTGKPNAGIGFTRNRRTSAKKRQENDSWALDDKRTKTMLLEVFPNLRTNPTQLAQAVLWNRVIQLYFRGHNGSMFKVKEIADELNREHPGRNISAKQVKDIVCCVRRTARGVRADGKPRTGRKRGRPKKINHIGVYF
jgi:hypothetical protein